MLLLFLPDAEPQRSKAARAVARALIDRARSGVDAPRGMLIEEIDGQPASLHPDATYFIEAGFVRGAMGLQATFVSRESRVHNRQATVHGRESLPTVPDD